MYIVLLCYVYLYVCVRERYVHTRNSLLLIVVSETSQFDFSRQIISRIADLKSRSNTMYQNTCSDFFQLVEQSKSTVHHTLFTIPFARHSCKKFLSVFQRSLCSYFDFLEQTTICISCRISCRNFTHATLMVFQ